MKRFSVEWTCNKCGWKIKKSFPSGKANYWDEAFMGRPYKDCPECGKSDFAVSIADLDAELDENTRRWLGK